MSYIDVLEQKRAEHARLKAHNDFLEEKKAIDDEIAAERRRAKSYTFWGRLFGRRNG